MVKSRLFRLQAFLFIQVPRLLDPISRNLAGAGGVIKERMKKGALAGSWGSTMTLSRGHLFPRRVITGCAGAAVRALRCGQRRRA